MERQEQERLRASLWAEGLNLYAQHTFKLPKPPLHSSGDTEKLQVSFEHLDAQSWCLLHLQVLPTNGEMRLTLLEGRKYFLPLQIRALRTLLGSWRGQSWTQQD